MNDLPRYLQVQRSITVAERDVALFEFVETKNVSRYTEMQRHSARESIDAAIVQLESAREDNVLSAGEYSDFFQVLAALYV